MHRLTLKSLASCSEENIFRIVVLRKLSYTPPLILILADCNDPIYPSFKEAHILEVLTSYTVHTVIYHTVDFTL